MDMEYIIKRKDVVVKLGESNNGKYKELGQAVKAMRKNRKVSQEELSIKATMDRTGISKYENGATTPTVYALKDISKVLDYGMEVRFKEDTTSNEDIVNEEYVAKFMKEANNENSLAYAVLNRLDVLCEKYTLEEVKKNHMKLTFASGKIVEIMTNIYNRDLNKIRFVPMIIIANILNGEGYESILTWHYHEDSKADGLSEMETGEVVAYINDCYYLGELYSIYESLGGILKDKVDRARLQSSIMDSYYLMKTDYQLNDEEIFELTKQEIGTELNNYFISLLVSSHMPEIKHDNKADGCMEKMALICEEEGLEVSGTCIRNLFSILYCIKFSDTVFCLSHNGSDPYIGSYICNRDNLDSCWGHYVVESHIMNLIDECFNEISEIYTEESSIDIMVQLLTKRA